MSLKAFLDHLQELHGKATKGPWKICCEDKEESHVVDGVKRIGKYDIPYEIPINKSDCEFITETRNALPKMIEAMRVLYEQADEKTRERVDELFKEKP